jgi:hypothetical protein
MKLFCDNCGCEITVRDVSEENAIRKASECNQQGPFCDLCRHLEMASRFAAMRGLHSLAKELNFSSMRLHESRKRKLDASWETNRKEKA